MNITLSPHSYVQTQIKKSNPANLGQNLKKGSLVVIGGCDYRCTKARQLLLQNGFDSTYVDKVYEKMV